MEVYTRKYIHQIDRTGLTQSHRLLQQKPSDKTPTTRRHGFNQFYLLLFINLLLLLLWMDGRMGGLWVNYDLLTLRTENGQVQPRV